MAGRPESSALKPSIRERISVFNSLADGGQGAGQPAAGGRRAVSSPHDMGRGTAKDGRIGLSKSPVLDTSQPPNPGFSSGSESNATNGLGIATSGDRVLGASEALDAFTDRIAGDAPLTNGPTQRLRAGSASVVDGRGKGRAPPPPVPRRPLNGRAAPAPAALAIPAARPRAGSHLSPLAGRAPDLSALDRLSTPLKPDSFGSPVVGSPHLLPAASPRPTGSGSGNNSPRLPVASIISLYNNPPTVSSSSTGGSRGASPVPDSSNQAGPLSSSPTSERSLDRLPAMTPSPMSSRPSSPFKSLSTSPLASGAAQQDEFASIFDPPTAHPTPPRTMTPSSVAASWTSSPSPPPPPRKSGQPKGVGLAVATAHPLAPSIAAEEAPAGDSDMISFSSPSSKQSEWSGRFQLQPPTPLPASRTSTTSSSATEVPSPPRRGSTLLPSSEASAARASVMQTAPLPASLGVAAPRLPPRRASSASLSGAQSSPALPPSLPPRRTPNQAAETTKTHARNLTNSSFHSISLSSDGGEAKDEDADLVKVDWTGSSAPQGKPVASAAEPSLQTRPTLGSGNLSSFNRAPLPPPKRKSTVSSTSTPPRSRASTPVARTRGKEAEKEKDREREKTKAVERYEVLWDAQCAAEEKSGRAPQAGEERRLIGVVVRELWGRSRLPNDVLARIWMSCDPYRRGSLDREGFVKGMSLIENELRRRRRKKATTVKR